MQTINIVIGGASEVGKQTFIESIRTEPLLDTKLSLSNENDDYHTVPFGGIETMPIIRLFGFDLYLLFCLADTSIEGFLNGLDGFCLLIDSTNPRSIYEGQAILKYLTLFDPVPHIIVTNKQDREDAMTVGQIRREMELPAETLILPCVATERASVANVLNTLLPMIRPDVQERIR